VTLLIDKQGESYVNLMLLK